MKVKVGLSATRGRSGWSPGSAAELDSAHRPGEHGIIFNMTILVSNDLSNNLADDGIKCSRNRVAHSARNLFPSLFHRDGLVQQGGDQGHPHERRYHKGH